MASSSAKTLLTLGAIAAGVALVLKLWNAGSAAAAAAGHAIAQGFSSVSDALASGLYSLMGPADTLYSTYARILFPDGSAHAIPTVLIGADGTFTVPTSAQDPTHTQFVQAVEDQWGGQTFQAIKNNATGSYQAFPVSA